MPSKKFVVPGVGAGLIIGEAEAPEESPEQLLRRREVEKQQFPAWTTDLKAEHTVAPILAHFARALVAEELGTDIDELPKLRQIVDSLGGTKFADKRKLSGKELKRLLLLADHVVRKFLPNAMSFAGGSDPARMLRALPPLRHPRHIAEASGILDQLARVTADATNPATITEDQFLLVNALSFTGLYLKGLTDLLRVLQDALAPATPAAPAVVGVTIATTAGTVAQAEAKAPEKPTGEVMDIDGGMVMDLVNYVFGVYGAARVLAFRSLGGRGAQKEVDRMGLACLVELRDV